MPTNEATSIDDGLRDGLVHDPSHIAHVSPDTVATLGQLALDLFAGRFVRIRYMIRYMITSHLFSSH